MQYRFVNARINRRMNAPALFENVVKIGSVTSEFNKCACGIFCKTWAKNWAKIGTSHQISQQLLDRSLSNLQQ